MSCKIAIDGPAGSGKTTVAKKLAEKLGYYYLDTGAMYRIVGLYLHSKGITPEDEITLSMLEDIDLKFIEGKFFFLGKEAGDEIRTPDAGKYASLYARHPVVRKYLTSLQKKIAQSGNIVVEGRDIGTVVIPDAEVKIFLEASPEARARRRFEELKAKGLNVEYSEILNEILLRDKQDSERDIAPLKPAEDAFIIDTTNLSVSEVIEKILEVVKIKCR
ncbi:(d)CMP kinase [Thermosipho ferrireducens]|uniref:Cytidylate kinase n=1 Tax=Thermosipho ferrireducens TaxID=2571116 RepID=A0ABX7S791_9BACT|nr:(d)CMP kinase [Thermosipho ferrireducens]QTA37660.1 (d)CMP kinase [Thermosipho ferrireducens]